MKSRIEEALEDTTVLAINYMYLLSLKGMDEETAFRVSEAFGDAW